MRILPPVRRDSISTAVTTRRLHKRLSTPAIGSGEIDENGTAVTFGPQVGLRNRHRVLPIASAMLTDAQMLEFAIAVARVFELAGIGAIIAGALVALAQFVLALAGRRGAVGIEGRNALVPAFRRTLGRSILTGLELLVAADIIRTVSIEPTMENVLVLGLIVLIRTFLSMSLEVEINGRWPWQGSGRN